MQIKWNNYKKYASTKPFECARCNGTKHFKRNLKLTSIFAGIYICGNCFCAFHTYPFKEAETLDIFSEKYDNLIKQYKMFEGKDMWLEGI